MVSDLFRTDPSNFGTHGPKHNKKKNFSIGTDSFPIFSSVSGTSLFSFFSGGNRIPLFSLAETGFRFLLQKQDAFVFFCETRIPLFSFVKAGFLCFLLGPQDFVTAPQFLYEVFVFFVAKHRRPC